MSYEKLTQVQPKMVVGIKQVLKAIKNEVASEVYIATDADIRLTDPVVEFAKEANISVYRVDSMKKLGAACGIEVGTSAVAVKK